MASALVNAWIIEQRNGLETCVGSQIKTYGVRHLPLKQSELTEASNLASWRPSTVLAVVQFFRFCDESRSSVVRQLRSLDHRKLVESDLVRTKIIRT